MKSRLTSLLSASALAALALVFSAHSAVAQTPVATATLNFNDLGPSTGGTHMFDGYGGMRWTASDWHFMTTAATPTDTFLALSGTATAVLSMGGADFYFEGADFWSRRGLDATGSFYFVLYRDGVTVYNGLLDSKGRQVFDGTHRTFVPNYIGVVDGVAIAFAQGGGDWDHLAMDNFRVRSLADGATARPFVMTTAPYSFGGQQTATSANLVTGLRSASFSGKVQNLVDSRVSGTLSFTVEYRVGAGVGAVQGGRWSLVTDTRNQPSYTTGGAIASGAVLAVKADGTLAAGMLNLSMLLSDPSWPVSAAFNVPIDSSRVPKVKGNFTLTYPYIP